MLSAKPAGLLSKSFHISRNDVQVCTVEQSKIRESADVVIDGCAFVFKNELLGRDFLIERDGVVVGRADKRSLRRAFDVALTPESGPEQTYALEVGGFS